MIILEQNIFFVPTYLAPIRIQQSDFRITFDKTKNWWFLTKKNCKAPKVTNSARNGKTKSVGDVGFWR